MPLAHVYIGSGRDHETKKALIAKITEAFAEVLGSDRRFVWVVVHDVPRSDWGINGKPIGEPEP